MVRKTCWGRSLTLTRELAPVLAALMMVGQAGSAVATELWYPARQGADLSAGKVMGRTPFGYLVAPRFLAALAVYPIVTASFTLISLVGGYISGSITLALQVGVYWAAVHRAVQLRDIGECLVKSRLQ